MLFYLTNTLIVDKESPQFQDIRRSVRYIAMAVWESKHMLRGDYKVLEFFEKEFKNDNQIFPVFNKLVSRYSTYTVPNDICRYVEVINGACSDYEKAGHKIKQMPYTYFDDSMKVQAMTVMAEDEDDCHLFEYIIKHHLKINHLNYNYCFTRQGGGGSRIDKAVKTCLHAGKMVTCITDSDQRYKNQPLDPHSCGAKCGKIKAVGKIYYFLMLPVLEVENLVPMNHLDLLDWHLEQNRKDKDAFDMLRNNAHSELILPYFDMKEGIKKDLVEKLGFEMEKFAAMCCCCNPDIMGGRSFHTYIAELDSISRVYPRLRKRLMGDLAPKYREGNVPEPELMDFQIEAWNDIAKLLLDTTCARKKEAITV